jgi:hypothetical protein
MYFRLIFIGAWICSIIRVVVEEDPGAQKMD